MSVWVGVCGRIRRPDYMYARNYNILLYSRHVRVQVGRKARGTKEKRKEKQTRCHIFLSLFISLSLSLSLLDQRD